jgi:hypothetical protein
MFNRSRERAGHIDNLFRAIRDPEFRERHAVVCQQQQESRLQIGRWIFVLVAVGLAVLWVMNDLGHPL